MQFFTTGRDGTVNTMFHDGTGRAYHGTAFACPKRELCTMQCSVVVVRHCIVGSKQLLSQRNERKQTLVRIVRIYNFILKLISP